MTSPMKIIMNVVREKPVILLVGIFIVATGIIIPRFKVYEIICRNGLTKRDYDSINFRYIEKYAGLFALALGILTIINPFLWTVLHKPENIGPTLWISTFSAFALILILGLINKKNIYNS